MTVGTNKKGFTLVELLVVVSIIALLAAIILGALISARKKGQDAVRIQNFSQLDNAIMLYYQEKGRYPYQDNYNATNYGYNYSSDPTFLSSLINAGYISTSLREQFSSQYVMGYLNNESNVGGPSLDPVHQGQFSVLDCNEDGSAKAVLWVLFEAGPSALYPKLRTDSRYNAICYY